jgi:hypothetical protein
LRQEWAAKLKKTEDVWFNLKLSRFHDLSGVAAGVFVPRDA